MEELKIEVSKAADTLMSMTSLFNCSFDTAWDMYMHPIITEQFSYQEVKSYIDKKIALGKEFEEGFRI